MQDWKFRYNILKENCDDIVRERVKESSIAFANNLTNELEGYGIKEIAEYLMVHCKNYNIEVQHV